MKKTTRTLEVGPTDNTSDQRTPRQPLQPIPQKARESFAPYLGALPPLRVGDSDLTRIAPGRPRAAGEIIDVSGRITDSRGRALAKGLIEIWGANTHGRYTHREDQSDLPLDPNFLGLGRVLTDADGGYRFRTIVPGAYLARPDINRWRPRHLHLSICGGAFRLVTQMYFPGDPHNDTDPMRILMGDTFERNLGREYQAGDNGDGVDSGDIGVGTGEGQRGFRFDIVIGGRNATFFEE